MPGKPRLCEACKKTRASCGFPGLEYTHCGKCKEPGMINLTVPKCSVCEMTIPIYGLPGEKPTHCVKCKTASMVDVKTERCVTCKKKQPTYGESGKKAKYCIDCKTDSMIDVRSVKCSLCKTKQPVFGYKGQKKASHCGDCKDESMIDLKSRMCIICKYKNPTYGVPGGTNTHCKGCKLDGYIDIKNKKCIVCNTKQATYGAGIGIRASHCITCKPSGYIDVKHIVCLTPLCTTRANPNLKGYCAWCFQHLFPEDPRCSTIFKKTAETEVATAILQYDSSYKHDTTLTFGGCDCQSRRRVDFWKIINNTILAIEVDEHQHKKYNLHDETIRYDDLYMMFSGKWIFIRFNPDHFKGVDGKVKRVTVGERIKYLLSQIKFHEERILEEKNMDLIEIHRLFFDEII